LILTPNCPPSQESQQGEIPIALADLKQAILFDPYNPAFYSARANIYHVIKDYDKSIVDYAEAIMLGSSKSPLRKQNVELS